MRPVFYNEKSLGSTPRGTPRLHLFQDTACPGTGLFELGQLKTTKKLCYFLSSPSVLFLSCKRVVFG